MSNKKRTQNAPAEDAVTKEETQEQLHTEPEFVEGGVEMPINIDMVRELSERLRVTNEECKRLEAENEGYEVQLQEYADLMELANDEITGLDKQVKELQAGKDAIRAEVTAEKITAEFQEALDYKNKVMKEADEKAAKIISDAQEQAKDMAKRIVDEARGEAEAQRKVTEGLVKLQDDTARKLQVLACGIAETLKVEVGMDVNSNKVFDGEVIKQATPAEPVSNTAEVETPAKAEKTAEKATPGAKPAGWGAVKPQNGKASANAEALRARLGR